MANLFVVKGEQLKESNIGQIISKYMLQVDLVSSVTFRVVLKHPVEILILWIAPNCLKHMLYVFRWLEMELNCPKTKT